MFSMISPRWLIVVVDPQHSWSINRHERFWTIKGAIHRAEARERHFHVYVIDSKRFGSVVWSRKAVVPK